MKDYPKCETCEYCETSTGYFVCIFDGNNYKMPDNQGDCENHSGINQKKGDGKENVQL